RVDFPERHALAGDWNPRSVAAAIDQLMSRREVDLVITLGPVGSNVLAHRRPLPKPAIAALVIDAPLQGLAIRDGASGIRNLNYVNVAYGTLRMLRLFHELTPFRRLAVVMRAGPLEEIPE